jgi:hypothetical protein
MQTTVNIVEPNRQYYARPRDQRFKDMASLRASVERRRNLSRVTDLTLDQLTVETALYSRPKEPEKAAPAIFFGAPKFPFALLPTHWSFGQLCGRAKAPAAYLRELSMGLAVNCLQEGFVKQAKEEKGDTRLLAWPVPDVDGGEDDDTYELRAANSTGYGRIWDIEVVELVERIIDATGGKFTNPLVWGGERGGLYASDRDVFMFFTDGGSIVDGGSERDQLHRGFYVWNSEVGSAVFGIATFLFRLVCGNHQIWGAEQFTELRIRHTLNAPARFVAEAAGTLRQHIEAPAAPLEAKIRAAKAFEIPGAPDKDKLIEFGKKHGLTASEIRLGVSYAEREEGGEVVNLWNLLQGLTASARDMAWIDARVDLERRAGKLMKLAA